MNSRFFRNWLILLVVIGAIYLGAVNYWNYLLSAPKPENTPAKQFLVFKGESAQDIAQRLEKEEFIRSSFAFTVNAKQEGLADKIQAGDFDLSPGWDAQRILKELVSGVKKKWVTLIEGWRVEEMAEKLNQELGIKGTEFIKISKEGYMFPDTYLFDPKKDTAEVVVREMNANFDKKYNPELQEKIKKLGLTKDEGLVLASIVEREAKTDSDRQKVASVLLKRLEIDMGLNADATVQYALGKQADGKWWKKYLTKEDLKIDSPYNTYLYKGLPPTPICNPSLSSLQAVASATDTSFLYYYHDSKGVSHFAKTLDEHNQNIADYP